MEHINLTGETCNIKKNDVESPDRIGIVDMGGRSFLGRNETLGQDLVKAFRQSGFAIIRNSEVGMNMASAKNIYRIWQKWFKRTDKDQFKFDQNTQSGYFPFKTEKAKDSKVYDLKEFFHLFFTTDLGKYGFTHKEANAIIDYRNSLNNLGIELLVGLDKSLPINVSLRHEMPLSEMAVDLDLMLNYTKRYKSDNPPSITNGTLFRVLHYPPLPDNVEDGAVRAAAHEDINLITLLPAASAPGLQVLHASGGWIEVETQEGDIIANVGDMLQEATGGYLKSTTHRVVNPTGDAAKESRYSMPLFIHPRSDVRLSERYTAGEYLEQRLREIGLIK